ncbi:Major facilitator superfamily domain, general substrate transporter, partial [Metarhizium majus ARSEF 297]
MDQQPEPDHVQNIRRRRSRQSSAALSVQLEANTALASPERAGRPLSFWLAFSGLCINTFLFALDSSTLSVALPAIAHELHGTTFESFWAGIAYLLCVVITQPLYTSLSDVFGRKPLLYAALLLFAIGSLVFGLAKNMTYIIVGRALQGFGGGGMDLLSEIIITDITTLQERAMFLGLLAIPIAIGTIIGPTIGAVFSEFISWRWIGYANLPFVGLSFPITFFFLRLRTVNDSLMDDVKSLDWGGMALSFTGMILFVLPLSWGGALYSWVSWQTLVPLIIGILILVGYFFYEALPAAPIMPYRLLQSTTAKATLLGNFMQGLVLFPLQQYLLLLFQAVYLLSQIDTAVELLPTSITCVLAASGVVITIGLLKSGYLWSIRMFWIVLTVGTGLVALLDEGSPRAMRMAIPIIWGAGIGALLRLLHLPMQASVENVDDTGLAVGLVLWFRLVGGLLGLAVSSSIFISVFAKSIAGVDNLPESLAPLREASRAISFIPTLRDLGLSRDVLGPVLGAYHKAFQTVFYAMTAFGGVGFVSSLFTKELTLQKSDLGRQAFEGQQLLS